MKVIVPIFLLFMVIVVGSSFETSRSSVGISNLERNDIHQKQVSVPNSAPSNLQQKEIDVCRKPIRKLDPPAASDSTSTTRDQDESYCIPSMEYEDFLLLV